jgi:lysosomal acid lipase/cholesteryl ester hydrolase
MAIVGVACCFFLLNLLQHAHAQLPSPLPSTGFCEAFISPAYYKCTDELVQTQDGYLLAVQKITTVTPPTTSRGPAFLYHGIMEGGETWVLNPRDNSLPLMMANAGYEVWIGNTRSSNYTFGHLTYTRKDKEFWNWNWDNLVKTDLPTMLQHVYNSSQRQIYYVGYSQGTMTALASFSEGNTANLVSKAALMSPIASLGHITSSVASAASFLFVDEILLLSGVAEFNAYSDAGQKFMDITCTSSQVDCRREFMSQITGTNCCFNASRKSFYDKYSRQSTSMRNLAHMAQMVRSGRFSMWDHGFWNNIKKYNSLFPPEYDVSAIPPTLPILLAHGGKDALADTDDVAELIKKLQGTPQVVYLPEYAHADFVMGTNASGDVYTPIIAFFQA